MPTTPDLPLLDVLGIEYEVFKNAEDVRLWVHFVTAGSSPPFPPAGWEITDCEVVAAHFARVGVHISIDQAKLLWEACSENLQAGWCPPSIDCVAAFDGYVQDRYGPAPAQWLHGQPRTG